jgi:hypothetical protein
MTDEMSPDLEPAADILASLTSQDPRPYMTVDFGRQQQDGAVSVVVSENRGESLVRQLQDQLPDGLVGFIGTTRWLGEERHDGVELVAGPGDTQIDIVRLARTDAINYGMETEEVAEKLSEWDERFGIRITQAETDTVQFDLVGYPDDLHTFAEELADFCPDIVHQGVGSVDRLVDMLDVTGRVTLWWD